MKLIDAIEKVLEEDPRTRQKEYGWLFLIKTLRVLGFDVYIRFDRKMPSPETFFREKREILNKRNKYAKDFEPEYGVTIEPKPKEDAT